MSLPAWRADDASVARELRTDSEALRYAEWWVRRRIYGLDEQERRWLFEHLLTVRQNLVGYMANAWGGAGLTPEARQVLVRQIEAEMTALMPDLAQHIFETEMRAARQGYYGRAWALDAVTRPDVSVRWMRLPDEAIRALVLTPYLGQQWGENLALARDDFVLRIKKSLVTSMIAGEGIQKAKMRLDEALGIKPGAKEAKGFAYRTTLIARTEILRASNLGALTIYEQNQDILSGWEWVTARDERVCPRCGALDGKRFGFDDPYLAPPSGSHAGCRCTAVPVLIDESLMDRLQGGPRILYPEWAAMNGIPGWDDGGLAGQRGARPPANE